MGKNAADTLFASVRREVLAAMLLHPQKSWYLSALARHLKAAPSHLHRELFALTEAGILIRRVEGRQTYFEANPSCPFLDELTGLLQKLVGWPVVIEQLLGASGSEIVCAFVYGSLARGTEEADSDVDLMLIGDIRLAELLPYLRRAERKLGRAVNPTIYPPKELAEKYRSGNHFIRAVLDDPSKRFVIGSADDLERATFGKAHQNAPYKQGRTRRAPRRRRSKA